MECTHDEERCRAFSFGIGVKGNSSCELSSHAVKETVDLKPIGTVDDTDYDLYIKKLGCKLVVDVQPNLPDFVNDEPYELEDTNKAKPPSRPNFYKKHHNSFHYGIEHHSHNPESHWSMKNLYKGNKPADSNDRAVSYNKYETPEKPEKYGFPEHKPNGYDNFDIFSFSNPYDVDTSSRKPQGYYSTEENKYKPSLDDYSGDNNKPTNSGYGNRPPSSEYGSEYASTKPPKSDSFQYDSHPKPPFRPIYLNDPYNDKDTYYKPSNPQYQDPDNPNYKPNKPQRPSYGDSTNSYINSKPQNYPSASDSFGGYQYNKPSSSSNFGSYHNDKPYGSADFNGYHYQKPGKPFYGSNVKPVIETDNDGYEYPKRPGFLGGSYGSDPQGKPSGANRPYSSNYHILPEIYSPSHPYQRPVIKDSVDPYGHLVTSVITEIGNVCFRRALAAKRVSRIFVRKVVSCERVDDCQQECTEEKRFVCEGFNYRVDPSGHGRGDCELIDVPYIRLNLRDDIIRDPDYDYYEKDRNCKEDRPIFRPSSSGGDRLPRPSPPTRDWYSNDHFDHYDSRDRFRDRYDAHVNYDHAGPGYDIRPPMRRPYNRRSGEYKPCPFPHLHK